jgi:hypothetical protein
MPLYHSPDFYGSDLFLEAASPTRCLFIGCLLRFEQYSVWCIPEIFVVIGNIVADKCVYSGELQDFQMGVTQMLYLLKCGVDKTLDMRNTIEKMQKYLPQFDDLANVTLSLKICKCCQSEACAIVFVFLRAMSIDKKVKYTVMEVAESYLECFYNAKILKSSFCLFFEQPKNGSSKNNIL